MTRGSNDSNELALAHVHRQRVTWLAQSVGWAMIQIYPCDLPASIAGPKEDALFRLDRKLQRR